MLCVIVVFFHSTRFLSSQRLTLQKLRNGAREVFDLVKLDDELVGHPATKILQERRRAGLKENFDALPAVGKGRQIIKALVIEVENHEIDGNVVESRNDVIEMMRRPDFVALALQSYSQQLVPQRIGFVEQDGCHGVSLLFVFLVLVLVLLLILSLLLVLRVLKSAYEKEYEYGFCCHVL